MVTELAAFMLVLGLLPAALYVLGRIKDPFHPLILVGVACYFVSAHQLLVAPEPAFVFLPREAFGRYLGVAVISLLGFYAGWLASARRDQRGVASAVPVARPNPQYILLAGAGCMLLSLVMFVIFYGDNSSTGYLRDLEMLWITSAILMVQLIAREDAKKFRIFAVVILLLAIVPPLSRFWGYGQRGDTVRLALIASVFYLMRGIRPRKLPFIAAAIVVALVLATLAETRAIVISDPSYNRITALQEVIPHFIETKKDSYSGAEEFIFGAALDEAAAQTGEFGYGKAFTVRLISRFAPKEYFPDKWEWFNSSIQHDFDLVHGMYYDVPGGSAISGAAEGYAELGWYCPILWFILGFIHQKLWHRTVKLGRSQYIGYLIAFDIAMIYGILQDFSVAEVNFIYVMAPLYLIYHFPAGKPAGERELDASSGPAALPVA